MKRWVGQQYLTWSKGEEEGDESNWSLRAKDCSAPEDFSIIYIHVLFSSYVPPGTVQHISELQMFWVIWSWEFE